MERYSNDSGDENDKIKYCQNCSKMNINENNCNICKMLSNFESDKQNNSSHNNKCNNYVGSTTIAHDNNCRHKMRNIAKKLFLFILLTIIHNVFKFLHNLSDQMQQFADKVFSHCDRILKKISQTTGLQFAPMKVPLQRRLQTFAVLIYILMIPICFFLNILAFRLQTGIKYRFYAIYMSWKLILQPFHKNGGLPISSFRSCALWQWLFEFFPITLHRTCSLDPNQKYIFGYHPHGIIGMGAWGTFATQSKSFKSLFPEINVRLLTLRVNFFIPFMDLFLTFMGVCDVSRESCDAILSSKDKKSIAIVLGGAKESLDAHPGNVLLYLKNRKGFVKVALEHGASLVPVFAFGENELYNQVNNPKGSFIRMIQDKMQTILGFATPIFSGRGIFQYNFGLLPRRKPINVIFGTPIKCPLLPKEQISNKIIDFYHSQYVSALKDLFDKHKYQFYAEPYIPEIEFL